VILGGGGGGSRSHNELKVWQQVFVSYRRCMIEFERLEMRTFAVVQPDFCTPEYCKLGSFPHTYGMRNKYERERGGGRGDVEEGTSQMTIPRCLIFIRLLIKRKDGDE